jgi:hypothetical protein
LCSKGKKNTLAFEQMFEVAAVYSPQMMGLVSLDQLIEKLLDGFYREQKRPPKRLNR